MYPAKFHEGDHVRVITSRHTAWAGCTGVVTGISGLRALDPGKPRYIQIKMDGTVLAKDATYKENELDYANAIRRLGELA